MPDRIGREALSLPENGTCFSTLSFNSEPVLPQAMANLRRSEGRNWRESLHRKRINEILTPAPTHNPSQRQAQN